MSTQNNTKFDTTNNKSVNLNRNENSPNSAKKVWSGTFLNFFYFSYRYMLLPVNDFRQNFNATILHRPYKKQNSNDSMPFLSRHFYKDSS